MMLKRTIAFVLLLGLGLAPALAQIQNPGFETGDLTGWASGDNTFLVPTNDAAAWAGTYGLTFWANTDVTADREIHQSVTGLSNGDYYLAARVSMSAEGVVVKLRGDDNSDGSWEFEKSLTGFSACGGYSHLLMAVPVTVSGGNLDIQIYMSVPSMQWAMVDDVQLIPKAGYDWKANANFDYEQSTGRSSVSGDSAPGFLQWDNWMANHAWTFGFTTDTPHRGSKNALFYKWAAYGPHQLYKYIFGVPNGDYYLTVFLRGDGTNSTCNLSATNGTNTFTTGDFHQGYNPQGAGDPNNTNKGYGPVVLPVTIIDGSLKIKFVLSDAEAGSLGIDDWALVAKADWTPIKNPGFEQEGYGWTVNADGAGPFYAHVAANNHGGDECLNFWKSTAYNADVSQSLSGIAAGTYTLSVWVNGLEGQTLTLTADNGTTSVNTAFSPSGATAGVYTEMTKRVNVTTAGTLSVSLAVQSGAGLACLVDDFSLTLYQVPVELSTFSAE